LIAFGIAVIVLALFATALNVSYMAEQLSLFSLVVGIALLLAGVGFIGARDRPRRPAAPRPRRGQAATPLHARDGVPAARHAGARIAPRVRSVLTRPEFVSSFATIS
jgi:hypothetical protein